MKRSVIILLVEDDQSMLDGMSDLLQVVDIGYSASVMMAGNGQEALSLMARQTPDLIVSDIMMPQMDGFQFLSRVQENPAWAGIPFIFLTARGEKHEIHKGRLSGAALYITKPFHSLELLELIRTQLDRKFQLEQTQEQSINNLKKDILQIINHEFRTPLTYVTAYYEMLADSVNTYAEAHNFQEYLRGIQAGCVRLTRLIESFIAVIELRSGEAQVVFMQNAQPLYDMDGLIQEVAEQMQGRAAQFGVQIHYESAPGLPPVFGEPAQLQNVFGQLIDNAVKFSSSRLTSSSGALVRITTAVSPTELSICIQDQGVGLPQQIQNQVFDLFVQYNRGHLEQQGAGAGLTIAKGLAELHNGRIELTSEENVGSVFTVVLPIYVPGQGPTAAHVLTPKTATVLIVEDEQFLLEGLRELLEIYNGRYKLIVHTATNGQKGVESVAQYLPDLIVSDIMMPVMDGYSFLREVRLHPEWVHIPFIFLTAKGERRDIHKGLRSGVEEYITKPYDSDELLGLIVKQLDRHFQMKRAMSRNFDALKRSIIELITPDFRVPLASVARYSAELEAQISETRTDDELKLSLQGIQASSIRLSRLVEDFIALAELKTGEAEMAYDLRVAPINDLGLLVYEVVQLYNDQAVHKGWSLNCPLQHPLPMVWGDRTTLMNCVQRLLDVGLAYGQPLPTRNTIHVNVGQTGEGVQVSLIFPFALPPACCRWRRC